MSRRPQAGRSPFPGWGRHWLCALLLAAGSGGCHTLKLAPPSSDKTDKPDREVMLPPAGKRPFRVAQFIFHADFDIQSDAPLFAELAKLGDQVHKELQLPSASTLVHVYLFETREGYERFMQSKYPDLPKRRAFFVAQPHTVGGPEDLLVYTFWGNRIREDLRHELTHALLHSVLKDVPLWLDEGLAEFFEVPPEWTGINPRHLEQIQLASVGSFSPNLERLEQLSQVQQMTPAEYREAWAWVHLMLRGPAETRPILIRYLQELRVNRNPGPLQPRLIKVLPDLEDALHKHVAMLDADKIPVPTVKR